MTFSSRLPFLCGYMRAGAPGRACLRSPMPRYDNFFSACSGLSSRTCCGLQCRHHRAFRPSPPALSKSSGCPPKLDAGDSPPDFPLTCQIASQSSGGRQEWAGLPGRPLPAGSGSPDSLVDLCGRIWSAKPARRPPPAGCRAPNSLVDICQPDLEPSILPLFV